MYTTCLIKILALVKNYFRGVKPIGLFFSVSLETPPSISEAIKLFFIRTRVNLILFDEFCNWIILIWADQQIHFAFLNYTQLWMSGLIWGPSRNPFLGSILDINQHFQPSTLYLGLDQWTRPKYPPVFCPSKTPSQFSRSHFAPPFPFSS